MPTKSKVSRRSRVARSSGSVFADLQLPYPALEEVKAQLTLQIYSIIKRSGRTQAEIAEIIGVRQPQVSLLMRNRAGTFSVGRLLEFLTALRHDVQIRVRPSRNPHGALSVISTS